MWARVSRYTVPSDRIEEDVRGAEATGQRISEYPGPQGLYYLVDRKNGKTMAVTLWGNEEDMRASEDFATSLRAQTSSAVSADLVGVERYEVVVRPDLVPRDMLRATVGVTRSGD